MLCHVQVFFGMKFSYSKLLQVIALIRLHRVHFISPHTGSCSTTAVSNNYILVGVSPILSGRSMTIAVRHVVKLGRARMANKICLRRSLKIPGAAMSSPRNTDAWKGPMLTRKERSSHKAEKTGAYSRPQHKGVNLLTPGFEERVELVEDIGRNWETLRGRSFCLCLLPFDSSVTLSSFVKEEMFGSGWL